MAAPFIKCPYHGLLPADHMFSVGGDMMLHVSNFSISCPKCGAQSPVVDGTYEIVGSVIKALHDPSVTFDEIRGLKRLVEAAQAGASSVELGPEVRALPTALRVLWLWLNENGAATAVVLTVLALYLQIVAGWSSDEADGRQLKATQTQTLVETRILEEIQKQTAILGAQAGKPQPTPEAEIAPQPRTPATAKPANRHERRKAIAEARRCSRKPR